MSHMITALLHLMRDETGQDLVEYALISGLVAVGTGVMMPETIFPVISGTYSRINSCMVNAGS
jgi:Flp pilus assembly pilin Flp